MRCLERHRMERLNYGAIREARPFEVATLLGLDYAEDCFPFELGEGTF